MDLKYERAWTASIGGEEMCIGVLARALAPRPSYASLHQADSVTVPRVFAAGHTMAALRRGWCGFGASTAEAVANYLRRDRPDNDNSAL